VIETLLDPRQAMVACLDQWRRLIVDCADVELPDQVRDIESVSRMAYSVMLDAVAELDSRNVAVTAGFRNTKQLLAGMLNLSPTEAGTRVTHATQLSARRALTGDVLAPLLSNTATALAAGEIGPGQVRVITETMTAIPASVSATDRDAAEAELARHARSFNPTSLHKIGQRILAHLDPDGSPPRDEPEPAAAAGELRFRNRRDGRLGLEGFLEPEHGAAFRSLIEQLAPPRPTTAGIPDPRSNDQRNADALLEVCGLARAAQACPTAAGEPPHLTLTIDWDALRTSLGVATLDYGPQISAAEARRWACDAKIIPVVLGGQSEPLDVAGPCEPFRWPFAARLSPETADVRFRAAIGPRECAGRITGGTGLMVVTPVSTIASCYVKRTIGTCITPVGKSSSTPATSNSSHPQS
jgi:hypothetical protein